MTDLNQMYMHYLITERLNTQKNDRAAARRLVIAELDTVPFWTWASSLVMRPLRLVTMPGMQKNLTSPVGAPVSSAFVADMGDCV